MLRPCGFSSLLVVAAEVAELGPVVVALAV
jgi:hypothetical protein